MEKGHQFKAIYPYFIAAVNAFYLVEGDVSKEYFKYAIECLRDKAHEIDLTVGLVRDGDDIILIVEKLGGGYTIVSADLDLFTYEDEEEAI